MKEDQYMKERVNDQINWYSKKSTRNKQLHLWMRGLVIVFSAIIPFAAGFVETNPDFIYLNYIIGILGMLVAILTGISSLMKYQEKWVKYRTASETLKHEKFLYVTKSGEYKSQGDHFSTFVNRVESLISKENSLWNEYMVKEE